MNTYSQRFSCISTWVLPVLIRRLHVASQVHNSCLLWTQIDNIAKCVPDLFVARSQCPPTGAID